MANNIDSYLLLFLFDFNIIMSVYIIEVILLHTIAGVNTN